MMVECNVIIRNCYEHINDLNSSLHFTWVIKYSKQLRFKIQTFTVHEYVWYTKIYQTIQAAQSLEINNGLKFCTCVLSAKLINTFSCEMMELWMIPKSGSDIR